MASSEKFQEANVIGRTELKGQFPLEVTSLESCHNELPASIFPHERGVEERGHRRERSQFHRAHDRRVADPLNEELRMHHPGLAVRRDDAVRTVERTVGPLTACHYQPPLATSEIGLVRRAGTG